MEFKTHEFNEGRILVVDVPERLTFENSDQLKAVLSDLLQGDQKNLVINLAQTRYIDSSGLGTFVAKIGLARSLGGDIRLASLQEYTRNLVEITHINKVIRVFDTVSDAVFSFEEE